MNWSPSEGVTLMDFVDTGRVGRRRGAGAHRCFGGQLVEDAAIPSSITPGSGLRLLAARPSEAGTGWRFGIITMGGAVLLLVYLGLAAFVRSRRRF